MEHMALTIAVGRARGAGIVLTRERVRWLTLAALVTGAAAYYAASSLLIHYSFHSFGWDLGLFDQLLWNLERGNGWEYSFRQISYLGDHFQPLLLLLVPLVWLDAGPAPLLVAQALALAAGAIPLFAAARLRAGETAAWLLAGTYLLSLPVMRAVNYDFHVEAFVPLLAFAAFWGLVTGKRPVFAATALLLLGVKEDAVLIVLGLCWLAWFGFGERRLSLAVGGISLVYAATVMFVVMPHYLGDATNPMIERYGYLGNSAREIAGTALTRPDLLAGHLARWDALGAVLLLLAGAGFLSLFRPALALPLIPLLAIPLLAEHPEQSVLEVHYGLVPMTYALCVAVLAVPTVTALLRRARPDARPAWATAAALAAAVAIFAIASPLPPSFGTYWDRFHVDDHSRTAASFLDGVPKGARVSAQATYVPHLTRRADVYEFPRVVNATYVLLDDKRRVPYYDSPGFGHCEQELPSFGFRLIRQEDGLRLYARERDDSPGPGSACD
jgi:uncharacterized membrane protein